MYVESLQVNGLEESIGYTRYMYMYLLVSKSILYWDKRSKPPPGVVHGHVVCLCNRYSLYIIISVHM